VTIRAFEHVFFDFTVNVIKCNLAHYERTSNLICVNLSDVDIVVRNLAFDNITEY
jgi:hypothetical protein